MKEKTVLALLLAAALILPGAALAQVDQATARAVDSLHAWQQADGGFTNGFAEGSNPGATADAVLALLAGGRDPAEWEMGGLSPLDYLEAQLAGLDGPAETAKVAMAVTVAGLDPRAFGGFDLLAQISEGFDPVSGYFGGGPFDSALVLLALAAAGEPAPDGALEGLLAARLDDGSYSYSGDRTPGAGDSNTTALVIQALVASGSEDQTGPSLDYLRLTQNADGGWTYQKPSAFGEETDANSTALAIQALLATNQDLSTWGDPLRALLNLQQDDGALVFNRSIGADNVLATIQAIPAMAGLSYSELAARAGQFNPQPRTSPTTLALGVLAILVVVLVVGAVIARRRG